MRKVQSRVVVRQAGVGTVADNDPGPTRLDAAELARSRGVSTATRSRGLPGTVNASPAELSRYEFSTASPAEAAAFVRSVYAASGLRLLDTQSPFRFDSGYMQNGHFSLEYVRVLGRGRIRLSPLRTASVLHLTRGALTLTTGEETYALGAGEMALLGPHSSFDLEWQHSFATVARLDIDELERVAAQASGSPRLDLDRAVTRPTGPPELAHLRATLDYVRRDVLSNAPIAGNAFVRRRAFEVLAAAVLNTFDEAFVAEYHGHDVPENAPPALWRACRYIEAQARSGIAIADVARATRVSVRTLQSTFHRYLGTTPSQYITAVRLAGAHADLLAQDAADGTTVERVMRSWHFTNSGRFAKLYRATYQEAPRTTLNR